VIAKSDSVFTSFASSIIRRIPDNKIQLFSWSYSNWRTRQWTKYYSVIIYLYVESTHKTYFMAEFEPYFRLCSSGVGFCGNWVVCAFAETATSSSSTGCSFVTFMISTRCTLSFRLLFSSCLM
jgi:hypothetical protein